MPTKTFTFSASADFHHFDQLGNRVDTYETKTITWTVESPNEIVGGTFLDGSPWVVDNGDLRLTNVIPAPVQSMTSFSLKYPDGFTGSDDIFYEIDEGEFILSTQEGLPTHFPDPSRNIETKFWKNQTAINPDFGKFPSKFNARVKNEYVHYNNSNPSTGITKVGKNFWSSTVDYITPCDPNHPVNDPIISLPDDYWRILTVGSLNKAGLYINAPGTTYGSDISPVMFFPFDGRGGKVKHSNNDNEPGNLITPEGDKAPIGTFYNKSTDQVWNRTPTKIEAGDMILSSISHEDPYWCWGVDPSIREGIIDMYGALTVISSARAGTAAQRFRPPINWDPADKANRPFYKERTIPSHLLVDKPDRGIDDTTATNPFTNQSLSDYYDYDKSERRLRTGTVVVWPGTSEWDDTFQGYARSFCRARGEYGSREAEDIDPAFLLGMDATLTDAERKVYRRLVAQRGLDLYGGYRSLGKYFRPNGGHSEPHELYLVAADMFAEPESVVPSGQEPEPYNLEDLMNGIVGNTGNNTLKTLGSNIPLNQITDWTGVTNGVFDRGIQGMSHYRAQNHHFGTSADIEFGCRVVNATVVSTGSSLAGSTNVPWVILSPPIPTNASTGGDKSNDSFGFFCGDDQRRNGGKHTREGRWGNTSNIPYMRNTNNFVGMQMRNNTTNETAMIIRDEVQGTPAVDNYGGSHYTDDNIKCFYTPGITFSAGDKVDWCPIFEEELGTGRAWFGGVNEIRNINTNAGKQQYNWSVDRCLYIWHLYKRILVDAGRSGLPKLWEGMDQKTEGIITDSLRRYGVFGEFADSPFFLPKRTVEPAGFGNFYQAYIRSIAIGVTGTAAPLYTSLDQLYDGLGSTGTWIPYDSNPANPTVLLGDGLVGVYGSNASLPWKTIDAGTTGEVNRFYWTDYVDGDGDYRDAIFIQSSTGRSLPYSSYVQNKKLYVWFSGRNSPVGFTLGAETKTNDTQWEQTWTLDSDTKILPKTRPLGTDLLSSQTIFFAD